MSWLLAKVYGFLMRGVEREHLEGWRPEVLAEAAGEVLEIGVGTGANFPYYGIAVTRLVALEPSDEMREVARRRLERGLLAAPENTKLRKGFAERLPYEDGSFA
ncbi:MAG: class I SAM-dependent methyltransferase [Myxococcales bacterium]|nr:class I SAM-dependent methyltransferase [Myxococcales bacterium]